MTAFSCGNASENASITFATQGISIETTTQTLVLTVEVADTDEKRKQGLMHREELLPDTGMLFVFAEEAQHSFWMKNTNISLDILFINSNKEIVYIEQGTTPLSLTPISPEETSRYVVEVNAGFTAANSVNVGDRVLF